MAGLPSKVNVDNAQAEGAAKDAVESVASHSNYIDLDNFKLTSDTVKVSVIQIYIYITTSS